jgi:hypothetical protein
VVLSSSYSSVGVKLGEAGVEGLVGLLEFPDGSAGFKEAIVRVFEDAI